MEPIQLILGASAAVLAATSIPAGFYGRSYVLVIDTMVALMGFVALAGFYIRVDAGEEYFAGFPHAGPNGMPPEHFLLTVFFYLIPILTYCGGRRLKACFRVPRGRKRRRS